MSVAYNACPPILPDPKDSALIDTHHFTLQNAIYLTVKYSQTIESASLGQESNYWNMRAAYYGYEPQFNITGEAQYTKGLQPSYTLAPTMDWNTIIGSDISFNYVPTFLKNVGAGNTSAGYGQLTIEQPLLKNFGVAFNSITLKTAIYNYQLTNLTYKDSLMTQIVKVISAFRNVVQGIRGLEEARSSVLLAKQNVKNTRLKLENDDPKTTPGDLVQYEQSLATSEIQYLNQRNTAETEYQTLLAEIGLPVTAKLTLDDSMHASRAMIPSESSAIKTALENNIEYLQEKVRVENAKLGVISALNQAKWELTLQGQSDIIGPGPKTNPFTGVTSGTANNASVNLAIPLFNVANHVAIVNAKITLAQAQITLANLRRTLITTVKNEITTADFLYQKIETGHTQVALDRDSLRGAMIKAAYGQGAAFEVNRLQTTLLDNEIALIGDQINFENSITILNQTLGKTLEAWHLKAKY